MKTKSTDHLIADVLSMAMEIRQHVEIGRRHLTPLQIEGLSNAVLAIHNYLDSWKVHCEPASEKLPSIQAPPLPPVPAQSNHAHLKTPSEVIVEGHLNAHAGFDPVINQSVFKGWRTLIESRRGV